MQLQATKNKENKRISNTTINKPLDFSGNGNQCPLALTQVAIMLHFSRIHKMENTTALLWRQEDTLADRKIFVVEADDPSLANLPKQALFLHSDLATLSADQYGPWPQVPSAADLIVVILPKSRERLDLILTALSHSISEAIELWLVGPSKGGIKGALKQLKPFAQAGVVDVVDTARHCRLYTSMLVPQ